MPRPTKEMRELLSRVERELRDKNGNHASFNYETCIELAGHPIFWDVGVSPRGILAYAYGMGYRRVLGSTPGQISHWNHWNNKQIAQLKAIDTPITREKCIELAETPLFQEAAISAGDIEAKARYIGGLMPDRVPNEAPVARFLPSLSWWHYPVLAIIVWTLIFIIAHAVYDPEPMTDWCREHMGSSTERYLRCLGV